MQKDKLNASEPIFKDDDRALDKKEREKREKENQIILEKELNKDERKRRYAAVAFLCVGLLILIGYIVYMVNSGSPLDRITRYEVSVEPQDDGALNITYRFDWMVLNDSREGPLKWVKIGMANASYTILETGGAIACEHYGGQSNVFGVYAMFDLDRPYCKGETAEFWFTVRQENMINLCNISDESYGDSLADIAYGEYDIVYEFIPGWFNDIKVDSYVFKWKKSSFMLTYNADRDDGEWLIWEGGFIPGGKRELIVSYSHNAFANPQDQYGGPAYIFDDNTERPAVDPKPIIYIIVILLVIAWNIYKPQTGYRGGRGFYGHGGHHGGHGGGCVCACACAGCACACACAGGGRAGCSAKDFYTPPSGRWDLEAMCHRIRGKQD